MCTPEDDSMQFLELLLGSAPISTENSSVIEDVFVDHNYFSLLESTEQVSVQNERNVETSINYKQEYTKTLRCLDEKNKDYDRIRRCLEEKNKDYDQLKQQYMKVGQDYAELHYESKKNALDAITANNNFEKITEELHISQRKLIAMENQYSVANTLHKAALSNNNQLSKYVEKLESDAANFKSTKQSYIEAIKEEKRNNSTLKNKIKTYEEDLCSIAGKLDHATDKKNRDRETQRQITKYTKKKFNADLDNIDSESVDTGRGSSFSNYSPAYSINFSPLNMTENFEQKIMNDASTSTLQTNETFDLSKLLVTNPSIEVGTKLLENKGVYVDSSKENIKTVDTASSPISFVDDMEKITTRDTASSPISFVEDMANTKLTNIVLSSFSGIRSPVARAKVIDLPLEPTVATSPAQTPEIVMPSEPACETSTVIKTPDMTMPRKSNAVTSLRFPTPEITRPLKTAAVTSPVVPTPEIPRPFKTAAMTSPVVPTPEITRPFKPAAVTSPVVPTPGITRPLKTAAVTSPVVPTPEIPRPFKTAVVASPVVATPEITRPFKPAAVTSLVIQTTRMTRLSKPSAVTSPVVPTPEVNRQFTPAAATSQVVPTPKITRPFKPAAEANPVVETPEIMPFTPVAVPSPVVPTTQITSPFKPAATTSPVVPTPEITRPFEPVSVSSLVVQTPKMTRPSKPASMTSPVVPTLEITMPLQFANIVQRLTDKTPKINTLLAPTVAPRSTVKTSEMTMQLKPTAVTKYADLLTVPNDTNDVKRQSLAIKISEMDRPYETKDSVIQEAKTTTSEHVIGLVNNNISVISKTPDISQLIHVSNVRRSVIQTPSRPMKHADARRPLIKNITLDETKQNENVQIFSLEKSITKHFKEIQSQDQERDDLEVRMILNKFRLDWNALSPMSITPDLDEEGLVLSRSDVRNDETERQSSEYPRSQISKESDSLLVITPNYNKLIISQNESNSLNPKREDDNPSHLKNKVLKLHSIPPIRHIPVDHENERQSDKIMHLKKTEAPVEIYEKYKKSNYNIERPQSPSELASDINSLESQSDPHYIQYSNSNILSHTSRNELTESQESIKKEYLLKEKQIDSIVSKSPEKRKSERIKSTISVEQSETNSVPQTQTKLQSSPIDNMSISKLPQSNTHKPPKRRRSERIQSTIPAAQFETKSITQTQTKLQSSPIDNMSISKEPQSNTRKPPKRRRSEKIQSTIPPAQSETKSITQTQTKLQSSPIDNMSISKEPQSNMHKPSEKIKSTIPAALSETKSITQIQTKLQSSPIDNMSISKEPQSNTGKPPKRRRSEKIKSTIPTAQSETKSITQTQTKLQSSPIDNMSISKEPQSNMHKPSEKIKSTIPAALSETKSITQTQTKLQSSPIDNMSISKEPQSNTRQPPKRRRSERIQSRIPPAQSETKSITQTRTKLQSSPIANMSISKEPQSNTHKPPKRWRSEKINSTIPAAQSETKSITQTQTKLQSSPIDNMSISKETQSNTRQRRGSERIQSTIPAAQSPMKSITHTQMKLQSSPIDNMSISKESQCNTSQPQERRRSEKIQSTILAAQSPMKSITKTQMKLQSGPIDNMSISKEPQSNPRQPPKRRRSARIQSRIPPAQSETKSITQTPTKLQSSQIENMSISKEPQSNEHSGCPPIIAYPEYGRKRTICRSMQAQSANENSKRQNNSECDISKCNSEICCEDKFTYSYSKPPKERISRVKASVSSNSQSIPNNRQSENKSDRKATEGIHKDPCYTPASKRAKQADDKAGFLVKPGHNINENYNPKMSITHESTNTKNNNSEANLISNTTSVPTWTTYEKNNLKVVSELELSQNEHGRYCADYNDMDMFDTHNNNIITHKNKTHKKGTYEWTHNLLDKMIFKYGSNRKNINKSSINDKAIYEAQIANEIENAVARCVNVSANPNKYYETLHKAVHELKKHSDIVKITGGLFKYLKSSNRKAEFLPGNKNRNYRLKPTPTKYVVSLMQILDSLDNNGLKIWEPALNTCRYLLFNLDIKAMPSLDVVESVTHLFVNMCQYSGRRNVKCMLLFMLAAMYCANYKAIIIIKHCLDLVPEILPHENENEKTLDSMKPLFQTFIFLLYFYNCEDQFGKVNDLRFTLKRRYCYDPTKDNETTILYMLKQTIIKIKDHYLDIYILEYSLLILAKRKKTKWCHKNIVQTIILPIIKGEIYASETAFRFCLRVITKLLKPYNNEMAVHTIEVVNLLMNIIKQPQPQEVKEDIICGLMSININSVRDRINSFLANWNPPCISPKFEEALKSYIERKPLKYWKYIDKSVS